MRPWKSIFDRKFAWSRRRRSEVLFCLGQPLAMVRLQSIIRLGTSMKSRALRFRGERRIETGALRIRNVHIASRKASHELQASGFADGFESCIGRINYLRSQHAGCLQACLYLKELTQNIIEKENRSAAEGPKGRGDALEN